mmetsp:Transcript_11476/g.15928  ORF Transcript_11476/g.15928 Transcript_11476/m.15928 type:complete len:170 (-) Transcript_11476:190-699(-)
MTRNEKKVYNADMVRADTSQPPPPQAFLSFKAYIDGYAASRDNSAERAVFTNDIPLESICELHSPQPRQKKHQVLDQSSPSCDHKIINVLPTELEPDQMETNPEVFEDENEAHSVDLNDGIDRKVERRRVGCCNCSKEKIYFGGLIVMAFAFALVLFILALLHQPSGRP